MLGDFLGDFAIGREEALLRILALVGLAAGVLSTTELDIFDDGRIELDVTLPRAQAGKLTPLYNLLSVAFLLLPTTKIRFVDFSITPRLRGDSSPPKEDEPAPTLASLW